MTLDEAIAHAEEVAKEQDKLSKRYDDASGYSRSHNDDIRTFDAKKCERCAEDHRQLAEWLKDYKRLKERESCEDWHDIPSGEMTLEQARQAVRELRKYVMDNHILSKSEDALSRQAAIDALEKCYTCKHVYQRVSDADTLYCRCRKGCRYEEVKPRRSGESPRGHEG